MSTIRDTVGLTVGRRIDHVFTRTTRTHGRDQVYLHFDDGTYIEFYGSFQCSSQLREESVAELWAMFESQRDDGSFSEYPARQIP